MTGEGPLGFDGGAAPTIADPPEPEPGDGTAPEPDPAADLAGALVVEPDEAGAFLAAIFYGLHVTLGAGGPDDAYLPTEPELHAMARPLASWSSRHQGAAAIVKRGDGFAFAASFGTFVVKEAKRTADHKRAERAAAGDVAADVAFGVTAEGTGPTRKWRPTAASAGAEA